MIGMNCIIDHELEKGHNDDIKVNTLSELIYPENHQQPPTTLRSPSEETETENTYVDEFSNEFSDPIDIVTENDVNDHEYHEEENEIPDETDDLESEFIQHETEPLLQDIANQMMHLIEQSSTTYEATLPSSSSLNGGDEDEIAAASTVTESVNKKEGRNETQTEATDDEKTTQMIDVHVKETSDDGENRNAENAKPVKDETKIDTEKLVVMGETESSTPSTISSGPSSTTDTIVDSTTQAIVELKGRTKIMEPNAELVSSTIVNFIQADSLASTTTTITSIESPTNDSRRELNFSVALLFEYILHFFHKN